MISDYFEYERALWHSSMAPWLGSLGVSFDVQRVLDIGCGYGGMLRGLTESFQVAEGIGIDLDADMIAIAQRKHIPHTQFIAQDLFSFDCTRPFDAVFLRDVVEHIVEPERALDRALSLTRRGGVLFVSYAPFYGPFGGHQHNGSGPASAIPWLQLLPEPLFRRLIRVRGNAYKGADRLTQDVESVLQTRLTLERVDRFLAGAGVEILGRIRYLVRPDYRIKFGLPTLALPRLPQSAAELLCTAEELVLRRT